MCIVKDLQKQLRGNTPTNKKIPSKKKKKKSHDHTHLATCGCVGIDVFIGNFQMFTFQDLNFINAHKLDLDIDVHS